MIEQFLRRRPLNQQYAIVLAAAVLLALGLYGAAWLPLANKMSELRAQNAHTRATLVWMREAAAKIKAAGSSTTKSSDDLETIVDKTLSQHGLAFSRIEPNDNSVAISLRKMPFDKVVAWLSDMELRRGVGVARVTISAVDARQVDANVQLTH